MLLNKGGGLNNCGIATPDSFEASLFIPILEEWYRVTNKSISWVDTQKGYFLNPTITYNSRYDGTNDLKCTHFTTHIHLIRCSYKVNPIEKKATIIVHYTVKIKNYNITNSDKSDRFVILPEMFSRGHEKASYKDHYINYVFDLPMKHLSKKETEKFIYDTFLNYANDIVIKLYNDFFECNTVYNRHVRVNGPLPPVINTGPSVAKGGPVTRGSSTAKRGPVTRDFSETGTRTVKLGKTRKPV